MYIFKARRRLTFESYITAIDTSDLIIALDEYLKLFKEKFKKDLYDKSSLKIIISNNIVFIDVLNVPILSISVSSIDQLDNQSVEYMEPIDLNGYFDYIEHTLMYSYLYKYAFVTDTGKFITGDYRSSTAMTWREIVKQVFNTINTKNVHLYYSECDDRKCSGYVRFDDGHTEDFNGIYKEEEIRVNA